MNRLLISLEERLGGMAVPGLVRYIMFIQAAVWVMMAVNEESKLIERLAFSAPLVLQGEWWRCVSLLAVPTGGGLLWVLMSVMFMIWVGDVIEQAWGTFRLNLYVFASLLCIIVHGLATGLEFGWSFYLLEGLVMAFALYVPEVEIYLYGLIPLRMKWIGLMAAGHIVFQFIGMAPMRGHILASLLPFFIVFGPGLVGLLKHKGQVMQRRQRFSAAQIPVSEALSTCHACGRDDKSHPELDFRVTAEGQDICSECRAKR